MNRINRSFILKAVQAFILPMMISMGFVRAQVPLKAVKPTNSMRTYYVLEDGNISARKPEKFASTVRAQNIQHARSKVIIHA